MSDIEAAETAATAETAETAVATAAKKYLAPFPQSWNEIMKTQNKTYGDHNPLCAIDSKGCSIEMADDIPEGMKELCLWHRARMDQHVVEECGCKKQDACAGDATGRRMFRTYHDSWDMPVIDFVGLYCCGRCQNGDSEVYMCGDMRVCNGCAEQHELGTLVPIEKLYSSDPDDSSDADW